PTGYFSPLDGYTLHITDLDPHSLSAGGGLEDVNLVKKYEISEEDYLKREDNFRAWKEAKKREDPSCEESYKELAERITVGDRCEVTLGGKRGEVRYVGKIPAIAAGWWVGVQYDEPVGK
ncbi:hypothetical protein EMIHUDRAFT_76170, partial [Emiliania huxleyi CCMP1516]|uniref:CAP-Gly domain-containing protein n=2 Tax=Emiliania huxleyi TaxID=2903 RepID=A0A0D3IWY7_EMIH1